MDEKKLEASNFIPFDSCCLDHCGQRNKADLQEALRAASSHANHDLLEANEVGHEMCLDPAQTRCDCCGLAEEWTTSYITSVREVFCGRFMCGLCAEAVKEEQCRMNSKGVTNHEPATIEAALQAHMAVCKQFKDALSSNPAMEIAAAAAAMRQLLARHTLQSPKTSQAGFDRSSSSCISAIRGECCA